MGSKALVGLFMVLALACNPAADPEPEPSEEPSPPTETVTIYLHRGSS